MTARTLSILRQNRNSTIINLRIAHHSGHPEIFMTDPGQDSFLPQ